jgi:thioesterase domain-containing protein
MYPVVVLSGAGGGTPSCEPFRAGYGEDATFAVLTYPDWQRHLDNGFGFGALVDEIVRQMQAHVPDGSIRILGVSLGAHFGYAAAIELQKRGRSVSDFCAVDSFVVHGSGATASPGWVGRALKLWTRLLSEWKFAELSQAMNTRLWRALLKLDRNSLLRVLRSLRKSGIMEPLIRASPLLAYELNMRLLIQVSHEGLARLDKDPPVLAAPAILLRTVYSAGADDYWRRRFPAIQICEIPGDHDTMFDPKNVPEMSRIFFEAQHRDHEAAE